MPPPRGTGRAPGRPARAAALGRPAAPRARATHTLNPGPSTPLARRNLNRNAPARSTASWGLAQTYAFPYQLCAMKWG